MSDLLIFGASGNSGLLLALAAREAGLDVAALARPGRGDALKAAGVAVVTGDAFKLEDCAHALKLARPRQVVSLLGGKSADGRRVDETGNVNVIAACEDARVEHALLVTSFGCGELYPLLSAQAQAMLGEAIRAKTRAEARCRAGPLTTTLLRPGGLSNAAGCGRWQLHDGADGSGAPLPRADLALAILALLADPAQHGRTLCVSGTPADAG